MPFSRHEVKYSFVLDVNLETKHHALPSDTKCPLCFRTLISILADLDNAVVWAMSILPRNTTFHSFFACFGQCSLCSISGITVNFMSYYCFFFFSFLTSSTYLFNSLFIYLFIYSFNFFYFDSVICWNGEFHVFILVDYA